MEGNGINFPAGQGGEGERAKIVLPPLIDVISPPDSKVCPLQAPTILMMPSMEQGGVLIAPGKQPQMYFVRHFVPCSREKCMFWRESSDGSGALCVAAESYAVKASEKL